MRRALTRIIPRPLRTILRQALRGPASPVSVVSSGYEPIPAHDVTRLAAELASAWKAPGLPEAQLEIVTAELEAFRRGDPVPVYDVFLRLVERIADIDVKTLLEVGCSSGYYADVLRARHRRTTYAGCDFAPDFVALARRRLPDVDFRVEDATKLGYADASWDVVVSGGCILHIPDYPAAILEASRVARSWVLFHRTPVLHVTPTRHYRKLAYGVPCIEIHFNETELLERFRAAGLWLVDAETVGVGGHAPPGDVQVMKSYLCAKR